jgi:hypothetical protein
MAKKPSQSKAKAAIKKPVAISANEMKAPALNKSLAAGPRLGDLMPKPKVKKK